MAIHKALSELYKERDRLDKERERLTTAIKALEGLGDAPKTKVKAAPKKKDGRSAPKPPVDCPFCGDTQKGMAGLAAHVRGSHDDKYPDDYEAWKLTRASY